MGLKFSKLTVRSAPCGIRTLCGFLVGTVLLLQSAVCIAQQQLFPIVALRHADVTSRDALRHTSCVDGGGYD